LTGCNDSTAPRRIPFWEAPTPAQGRRMERAAPIACWAENVTASRWPNYRAREAQPRSGSTLICVARAIGHAGEPRARFSLTAPKASRLQEIA
jgi:hypothetical protein